MEKKTPLELIEELDEMERSVNSDEAQFLDEALRKLKAGKKLNKTEVERLSGLHEKYLGEKEDDRLLESESQGENDAGDEVE